MKPHGFFAFSGIICLTSTHSWSQQMEWEGVWAQKKQQCLCEFYNIDTCPDGDGLPPLQISKKTLTGPEISCRITGVERASSSTFFMRASCTSEGNNGSATIKGVVDSGELTLTISASKSLEWNQGDYKKFAVKCRR